ncbi:hypothetical protein V8E36_004876 [Tilletia maclaganii]
MHPSKLHAWSVHPHLESPRIEGTTSPISKRYKKGRDRRSVPTLRPPSPIFILTYLFTTSLTHPVLKMADQQQQPPTIGSGPGPAGQGVGQQDALDKGIDQLLTRAGHEQSDSTTEKISDGVRSLFKKVTGKDVPIADKQ